MAFFTVTESDGTKLTLNTETIRFFEDYDQAAMHAELLREEPFRQRKNSGNLDCEEEDTPAEESAELRAALVTIERLHTKIHFLDGSWRAVRETHDEVRLLANMAVAELMRRPPESKQPVSSGFFSPDRKPG